MSQEKCRDDILAARPLAQQLLTHHSLCFLFLLNPGSLNVQGIDPGKEKESRFAAQRLSPGLDKFYGLALVHKD